MKIIEKKFPTETHYHILDDGEITGVLVGQNHIEGDVERAKKRAYLIGNASDLLKALEELLDCLYDFPKELKRIDSVYHKYIKEAHRAINKAKGEINNEN